ncbi:uncharacterized protein V6R79_001021 [Siganus canaliculatus]
MAFTQIAFFLLICFQGCDLTSGLNADGLQSSPDALRANGDVCKDCTQIFELLADLVSNPDLQKKITDGIESLCAHLPGAAAKLCKDEVEKMLPLAINFMTAVAKPGQICKMIGLCGSGDTQEMMLRYFVSEVVQAAAAGENVQQTPQCSFCLFLIKTLEDMLPKERTESAVTHLLDEICHILPATYRQDCEGVIDRFSKSVLDAILSYATPQAVCTLMHLCKGQEAPLVDPCSLATYRCRDVTAALRCGTLFYCQKFAWKPLNYNTL